MNRFNILINYFLIVCSTNVLQAQNPWTKSKGEGYAQLSFNAVNNYSQLLSNKGPSRTTERTMSDMTYQLYSEIGIGQKLSVITFIPLKVLSANESNVNTPNLTNSGTLTAIGNASIAIRKGFQLKSFVNSIQIQTDLPSSSMQLESGLISGFNAYTYSAFYSIGKSFSKKTYVFAYGGALFRNNGYSDQFRWGIEGGYQANEKMWIIFYIDHLGLIEENDKVLDPRIEANGLFLDEQMYLSPGFKFIYQFKNHWIVNSAIGGALSANNVAATPALSFGIAKEW